MSLNTISSGDMDPLPSSSQRSAGSRRMVRRTKSFDRSDRQRHETSKVLLMQPKPVRLNDDDDSLDDSSNDNILPPPSRTSRSRVTDTDALPSSSQRSAGSLRPVRRTKSFDGSDPQQRESPKVLMTQPELLNDKDVKLDSSDGDIHPQPSRTSRGRDADTDALPSSSQRSTGSRIMVRRTKSFDGSDPQRREVSKVLLPKPVLLNDDDDSFDSDNDINPPPQSTCRLGRSSSMKERYSSVHPSMLKSLFTKREYGTPSVSENQNEVCPSDMKDSLQADAVSAPAARKWFDRRMFGRAHSNDCLVADGLLQSKSPCDAEEDACTNEPSSSEDSDSSCQEDTLGDGGNEVQSRKVAIRKKSVTRDSKNEMKDEPRKLKYSKGDPLKSDSDIVPTSRRSKKKKLPTRSDLTRERRGVDRSYSMDSMNMRIMSQGNIGNVRRGSRKPRMTEGRRSSEIGKLERESSCLRIAIDPEKHTDISNAAIVPKLAPPRQIVRTESIRRKKVRNVEEESEWEECMTDGEEAVFDRRCHRTIHKTRKSRVNRSMSLDCTPTKSDDLGNGNKDLLATYGLSKMQPKLEDENVFGSLFHNEASWLDERNMTSLISGKTKTLSGTDKFSSAAEIALQRPSAVQHPKLPATGSGQLSRRS